MLAEGNNTPLHPAEQGTAAVAAVPAVAAAGEGTAETETLVVQKE